MTASARIHLKKIQINMRINSCSLLIAFFLILLFPGNALTKSITVVYTNSLNGNIDFCHCKGDPNGGLVKRATEIKRIKREYKNVFLFETGDFFTFENDTILAKYLIRAFKYINYDAVLFGDQEFSIGINGFLKFNKALPFVCNNILLNNGKGFRTRFKRFRIIKKGKIKVAVLGSIGKDAFRFYPRTIISKIKILNQELEIKRDIKKIKGKGVDFIILLSHSGYDRDIELSRKIPDIDLIIGGHSQTLIKKPYYNGRTVVVQAGAGGARIGILELSRKGEKIIYRNSFRRPDEFHPEDDKYIRSLINTYKKEIKKEFNNLKFE